MKVYVAGASSEIERAELMVERLQSADVGIKIVSTWIDSVKNVGQPNPADASHEQRRGWAQQDLYEVAQANVMLLLLPSKGHATTGAWAELAFAYAKHIRIIGAGSHSSIFTGLIDEVYHDDYNAYKAVCRLAALKP